MKIIIGLGNPGEKYEHTRHNIGFEIVDKIKNELNSSEWEFNKKFNAEISSIDYQLPTTNLPASRHGQKLLLVRPQTFMNLSGEAVQALLSFYKITPDDILVIHDDLDILVGNYKISRNVSSAGHNGIENIIEKLGTQDFTRVRIGVETAGGRASRQIPGEDFVLQKFSEDERKKIYPTLLQIVEEVIPKLITETK